MPGKNQQGKDRVLQATKEHDIRFVSLWFTDVLGFLKGLTITVEELEAALEDVMGSDGSSIEGFAHMTRYAIHTARSAWPGRHREQVRMTIPVIGERVRIDQAGACWKRNRNRGCQPWQDIHLAEGS